MTAFHWLVVSHGRAAQANVNHGDRGTGCFAVSTYSTVRVCGGGGSGGIL